MKQFLPISRADMQAQGIEQLDFVYVIGDAYVDHPSFGHAIISRILQANGFSVGIISQPDWKNPDSISILGEPKIGFIVTGGNMDSMVNHYSVSKKRRQKDAFTPGGIMGRRPDYATVVYCNLIRRTYKHTPLIIGGLEASLRRLGHYDYWWLWQRGCAVALISKILLISTARYTRQRIRTVYTMALHCHLTKKSVPARNPMPTVFIHNIAIRIHLQQNGSLSLIQINAMSCKIRHPHHLLPVRWMPYMHFLI